MIRTKLAKLHISPIRLHSASSVCIPSSVNNFRNKLPTITFQGGASSVDHLCYFCLLLLCFHARLFVDALWSPAGKGLTSWHSFVMSNCDVVTFPLVSCVRCGT